MATHTETASYSGRKFTISRKDGQQNKDGQPYFFEWVKEIPQVAANSKRIFESRPKKERTDHFELFQKIDGFFVGATPKEVNFGTESKKHLFVFLVDGEEDYTVDLGDFEGRYAMDFCKRVLDANFDGTKRISLQPYAIQDKMSRRWSIGVSVFSGVSKMDAKYDSEHLKGMPPADQEVLRNGTSNWYFDKQAEWLWNQVASKVIPTLTKDPISFAATPTPLPPPDSVLPPASQRGNFPDEAPPVNHERGPQPTDDLPF